jgi:hypothetical protein
MNKYHLPEKKEEKFRNQFALVPIEMLQSILDNQEEILAVLKGGNTPTTESVGDYITEAQAKKLIGRQTSWFWQMRKAGQLSFSKVGNKIFYIKNDILNLIKNKHNAI